MPKDGGSDVGYQSFPKIKSLKETNLNIGIPSRKRERTIRPSTTIYTSAKEKKIYLIIFSLVFLFIIFAFKLYSSQY
jgi:hypothetical protein